MIRNALRLISGVPWWLWVVFAAGAAYGAQELRVRSLNAANTELTVDRDSLEVASTATRELRELAYDLGDQVRIFQRRAFQAELQADELNRRLNRQARARIRAEARIDSIRAHAEAPVRVDTVTDTRSADFRVRQEPFTVALEVRLPPPPSAAAARVNVNVDPADVGIRVGCREGVDRRIRPASVTVTTPPWLRVNVVDVRQEPEVCTPPLDVPGEHFALEDWVIGPMAGGIGGLVTGGSAVDVGIGAALGMGVEQLVRWIGK